MKHTGKEITESPQRRDKIGLWFFRHLARDTFHVEYTHLVETGRSFRYRAHAADVAEALAEPAEMRQDNARREYLAAMGTDLRNVLLCLEGDEHAVVRKVIDRVAGELEVMGRVVA